jgi:peptidoglycan/LPS O-acetylase OafA/YrhL
MSNAALTDRTMTGVYATSTSDMKHRANLDILRAFAVGAVFVQHLLNTLQHVTGFNNRALVGLADRSGIGHAGVCAFFVHTSLVLMYSLQRMHQAMDRVAFRFYVRRFFRIYPLAIFSIVLVLVFHIPGSTWTAPDPISRAVIVSNLLLVQNIFTKKEVLDPLWSLPYEVQMYLLLPALYLLASRKKAPVYIGALLAGFVFWGALVAAITGTPKMTAYVPCFLSGVLCYSLRNRIRPTVPAALWTVFVLALIFMHHFIGLRGVPLHWLDWIFCILLGLGINMFHDSGAATVNLAANKIALYSYGIYLLHVPALYLVFYRFHIQGVVLGSGLSVLVTLAASVLAFHALESPCIEFGRKITSNGYRKSPSDVGEISPAP